MWRLILEYVYFVIAILKYAFFRLFVSGHAKNSSCLIGKTAIVTGGNAGIGYAISLLLASRGCRVIIADIADSTKTRDTIIRRTGNKNIISKYLDLSSLDAIREFVKDIKKTEPKIEILVNNAGVGAVSKTATKDGLNAVLQTNFLGPFLLTHLLLNHLKSAESARIVFTGSIMAFFAKLSLSNIDDIKKTNYETDVSTSFGVYQNSKLCDMLISQEFAKKLLQYNIKVNSCDPGMITTALSCGSVNHTRGLMSWLLWYFKLFELFFFLCGESIFMGAQTSFYLASSERLQETGEHFFRCQIFDKPTILKNKEFCERIWTEAEKLVKLKPEEIIS